MNANELLEQALAGVESKSIRDWAASDHNKPVFLRMAEKYLKSKTRPESELVNILTIMIVGYAMDM